MYGNCKSGDLDSHSPWTIIGDNFIQFSTVSIFGNFGTGKYYFWRKLGMIFAVIF